MPERRKDDLKEVCFGRLDVVFPEGAEGLREVPEGCFRCHERVACMKAALASPEGTDMQWGMVERDSEKGWRGRIKRWSRRKQLSRGQKGGHG
jgi:hypothetical protein